MPEERSVTDRPPVSGEPRSEEIEKVNAKARQIVGLPPTTEAGRAAHWELHRFSHNTATPCPGPDCPHIRIIAAIESEASTGAALDVLRLAKWLCEKFHRGQKMTWPLESCGTREKHLADAAEYARLAEQEGEGPA